MTTATDEITTTAPEASHVGAKPGPDPAATAEILGLADLITPMCVRVAATLRLPDLIAVGNNTIPELASATGSSARALGAVVDQLISAGVLTRDADSILQVTTLGDQLRLTPLLGTILDLDGPCGRFDLAMTGLLYTVRTERPSYEQMYGDSYWNHISADPELATICGQMQAPRLQFDAGLLVEGPPWSDWSSFLDLGGANGALASQLLQTHPHLHGGVLDLPNIVENARAVLRAAGVADRCDIRSGSFFEELPRGYDVYLLSAILWDWDDDQVVQILLRAGAAAGPTGQVLVGEISMDHAARPSELALRMLTTVPGLQRSSDHVLELAARAGLRLLAPVEVAATRYLLRLGS